MQTVENMKNDFLQQQLPRWNPNLTIKKTLPYFFIIGTLFVVIGGAMLLILKDTVELIIDYTYCKSKTNSSQTCADIIGTSTYKSCTCEIDFRVEKDIKAPVYVYYMLTNFFQNHRTYIMSRDNKQLLGELDNVVSQECKPYDYVIENGTKIPIAPCGAIANSLFSDEFSIYSLNYSNTVPLINTGIVWPQLKTTKYRNPPGNLKIVFQNFSKPLAWKKNIWELDPLNPTNNGFENEDFIIWMQPATLSSFRKLYRRINHTFSRDDTFPRGEYKLFVIYSYPVIAFRGSKSFVLANSSILGTRNLFFGIAYIITGCICIVIAIVFCILHLKYKKIA